MYCGLAASITPFSRGSGIKRTPYTRMIVNEDYKGLVSPDVVTLKV